MLQHSRVFLAAIGAIALGACATTQEAAAPAEPEAPEPPAPVYLLSDVLGAAPSAVDALLGAPALTRKEGAGEYRRYGLTECSLIIILYPDDSGDMRAAHVEATALTSAQEKPDLDACLAAG